MDNSQSQILINVKYRGRLGQIPIYFMKIVRGYVYQNDWIALPLSAVVAAMVSIIIKSTFAENMSGTLKGAFALSCVAIWNGCFNSIQSVCRERSIIKREHRSGMHTISYLSAHILFQAIVCLLQTVLTMYVLSIAGVNLFCEGVITSLLLIDIGITIFFITFAADMLALMISCIVKTTTVAMTVVPFLLIFQLVFSGGIFTNLPSWTKPISNFTLSKPGLNCIAAQAHYNDLPMTLGWQMIESMGDNVVVDQITVNDILETVGKDEAQHFIEEKMAASSYREDFASTRKNVLKCWMILVLSGCVYVCIALISLKFIDKDKR